MEAMQKAREKRARRAGRKGASSYARRNAQGGESEARRDEFEQLKKDSAELLLFQTTGRALSPDLARDKMRREKARVALEQAQADEAKRRETAGRLAGFFAAMRW